MNEPQGRSLKQRTNKPAGWRLPTALLALGAVPAMAGVARLHELSAGANVTPDNARFFAAPIPVVLHVVAVTLFSLLGAVQFVPRLRSRQSGWHRRAGWLLAACGLVSALSGLWMSHFYPWPAGDGFALYVLRLLFGSAMFASIVLAIASIRRRNFAEHGAWMTRGYAIGLGAGTQVLTHLPYILLVGKPGEVARTILMGAGWVINLAVAEWLIRRGPRAVAGRRATLVKPLADGG